MKQLSVFLLLPILMILSYSCAQDLSEGQSSNSTGSITRFVVHEGFMYALNLNELQTYSLADPDKPLLVHELQLDYGLETLIVYDGSIFIGARDGLYIVDLSKLEEPVLQSKTVRTGIFGLFEGCDPVVVKGNRAFSTVKVVQNICGTNSEVSQLLMYNISDRENPRVLDRVDMSIPNGLGYKDTRLFVCDEGTDQIVVFDISNTNFFALLPGASVAVEDPIDIIVRDDQMVVSAKNDFHIYDISNPDEIRWITSLKK
jgi:hypothetical protein